MLPLFRFFLVTLVSVLHGLFLCLPKPVVSTSLCQICFSASCFILTVTRRGA